MRAAPPLSATLPASVLLLLSGLPWAGGAPAAGASTPLPRVLIRCTPRSVDLPGRGVVETRNPIARALEAAGPGSRITLEGGEYPGFSIGLGSRADTNADAGGGRPGAPVIVEGRGSVRIVGRTDTIAIDQKTPNGHITFRNLTIVPGTRSGVIFYRQQGAVHRGYAFEDCDIIGRYDHLSGRGTASKWGVKAHSLADFRFEGVMGPARIENIAREHAFYVQNHRGPILIENVSARYLGRTFCQFTARDSEGLAGSGTITVRDCSVEDACIARQDGFKGGSAFTFAGRLDCTILLENNRYRAGFDARYRRLTTTGKPYGTGALTAWQSKASMPNGTLILRDNEFTFAPGCGDRPVVAIGGCRRVLVVGENRFTSGGSSPALALDPTDPVGRRISTPNGSVFVAPLTRLEGDVTRLGATLGPGDLARLQGVE